MTTDNFCFYLQNRLIQTSQTRGQRYSDTFLFCIPCFPLLVFPGQGFESRNARMSKDVLGSSFFFGICHFKSVGEVFKFDDESCDVKRSTDTQYNDIQHNDAQHDNVQQTSHNCNVQHNFMLSVVLLHVMLNVVIHSE
jgi:hypothetical protein